MKGLPHEEKANYLLLKIHMHVNNCAFAVHYTTQELT